MDGAPRPRGWAPQVKQQLPRLLHVYVVVVHAKFVLESALKQSPLRLFAREASSFLAVPGQTC